MSSTRIPKPSLKVPNKISKPVPVIPNNVLNDARPHLTSKVAPMAAALRRRSKSVSDLRSLHPKPLFSHSKQLIKVPEKTVPVKSGQKRPALQKVDSENKPKVPKMKIPDWDYKSRFLELQKKHTTSVEENKALKERVGGLPELEAEVVDLRTNSKKMIEELSNLRQSHQVLQAENTSLKDHLNKETQDHNTLKKKYEILQTSHNENLQKMDELESANEKLSSENTTLKDNLNREIIQHNTLKNNHDSLQATHDRTAQKLSELERAYQDSLETIQHLKSVNQHLKQELLEHETLRRSLHNTIQDLKGNIRVFCRVRPALNEIDDDKQLCAFFFPSESSLEIRKSRESVCSLGGRQMDLKQEFSFDKVFPPEVGQAEIFEDLAQLVQSALDGYNVCVFAYGQTGSGKTHTMQGSPDDQGMIPRTVDLIFEKIQKLAISDWAYTVEASFLEIYNENIRDLLVPNSEHNYELRYNEGRGVTVTNMKIVPISSSSELKKLMMEAQQNRAVAATDFNEHSSRSHAVTKINLEGYNNSSNVKYSGSITLVDLAGSESAKTSSSERLTETKNINKSLSTLGNVMLALHNKEPHIPYRNSKLTFLLQSCLGGNSKTLMFVNISPFDDCFNESINSLRFAAKVKEVKMVSKRNKLYC